MLRPLQTQPSGWDPSTVSVTLNIALDGCIVPTAASGARVDYAHLVVLDNFLDEATRQGLQDALTQPGWCATHPPEPKWQRATADAAARPATWGLSATALTQLATSDHPAKLEVQTRLCKMYPDMFIAHMPSQAIQQGGSASPQQQQQQQQQQQHDQQQQQQQQQQHEQQHEQQQQQQQHEQQHDQQQHEADSPEGGQHTLSPPLARGNVDCSWLLANAAVYGDHFSWHVDADPCCFPTPSAWTQQHGLYCNREPGKPLFVSLLVYLDKEWPRDNNAETLFLDSMTDTGVFVRPQPYRAVLMDQDVVHRLSTPSAAAGRPRYSLVWKLVMIPKHNNSLHHHHQQQQESTAVAPCIARREWGQPVYFGSAARVLRAARQAAATAAVAEEAFDPASPAGGRVDPVCAADVSTGAATTTTTSQPDVKRRRL